MCITYRKWILLDDSFRIDANAVKKGRRRSGDSNLLCIVHLASNDIEIPFVNTRTGKGHGGCLARGPPPKSLSGGSRKPRLDFLAGARDAGRIRVWMQLAIVRECLPDG